MRSFFGRRLVWLVCFLLFLLILWWCRFAILRSLGEHLVRVDPPAHADAMYVLGGAALERAIAAEKLFHKGFAPVVIFTGGIKPEVLRISGISRTEAEICRRAAVFAGIPEAKTELLEIGTSTREEAEAVRDQALAHGYDTVMVVTTEFHTRRVGNVFHTALDPHGITVLVCDAPSHRYAAHRWWQSEDGLIMVSNEYMKLIYYALTDWTIKAERSPGV